MLSFRLWFWVDGWLKMKTPGSFGEPGVGGREGWFTGYSFSYSSQSVPAHNKAIAGQPKMGGRKVSMQW